MDRNIIRNRIMDEDTIDSDSDFSADSEDEDSDYVLDENEDNESTDSDSSDIEDMPQDVIEDLAVYPDNVLVSKDKTIKYSKDPFPINRRKSYRRDTISDSGPRANACIGVNDCLSAFLLYLKPIETIVLSMTNLYGAKKYRENWENIDLVTLYAYFGLLLLAGVYRSYGECVTQLWDEKNGRPIFRATMPLKKFKMIQGCVRFDDRGDRLQRSVRDKLAPIRVVFDKWNSNLKTMYTPGKCVTIDEQLIPFRGRCPFRQYIPSKPAKYGIKMWYLCDSENSYAYNTQVYTGRDRNCRPERKQGERVVLELCEGLTHRNVTCDNFFTSHNLAVELDKQKMTIVGTIRKNRVELPPLLLNMKRKPVYSTEYVYEHNLQMILISYVPGANRFVTLMSTYHRKIEFEENTKRKPSIITYYNKTKGGVDTMDQMVGNRCKRKVNRWPMALFVICWM